MKALIPFIVSFVILCALKSSAQGFDWETSLRRPEYAPSLYLGAFAQLSTLGHTTDIKVLDQIRNLQPVFICADYNSGKGSGWQAGVQAEWWKMSSTSLLVRLSYATLNADFSADSPPARLYDGNIFQTQYQLSTSIHTLSVEAFVKTILGAQHFWGAAGIRTDLLLGVNSSLKEQVLSPNGYTFPGTNLQSKLLSEKDIAGVRSLVVNPQILLGYDVEMGRNCYSSLALGCSLPLMNYTSGTEWRLFSLNFQYSLVFGVSSF